MTELAVTPSSAASECIDDRRLVRRWIAIFTFFGLLWRLVRFGLAMPIWGDEAMLGLNLINRSYRDLLHPLKASKTQMKSEIWLRHDLQIGPKENGPAHLEVVHLVH